MDRQRRRAIILRSAALSFLQRFEAGASSFGIGRFAPVHKTGTKLAYGCRTMEPAAADQKRHDQRFRVFKAGTIEFSGHAIPCTVRNLSASGAAIEVKTPLWFPDHFTLGIASDGFRKACHIVWRDEQRIGLAFD